MHLTKKQKERRKQIIEALKEEKPFLKTIGDLASSFFALSILGIGIEIYCSHLKKQKLI